MLHNIEKILLLNLNLKSLFVLRHCTMLFCGINTIINNVLGSLMRTLSNIYNMSGLVVLDIQTRVEGEWLYI